MNDLPSGNLTQPLKMAIYSDFSIPVNISPIKWEGSTPAIFRFIQLQLLPYGGRAPPFYSDFRVITPVTRKHSPRKRFAKQAFHQKTFSKKTVYKTNLSPKNILQENGLPNKPFTKKYEICSQHQTG